MAGLESALAHLGSIEALAARATPVHRLDPRAKLLTTGAFLATVVSFGPRQVIPLLPLALYPVALGALGDVPARPVLARLALASPFVLLVAIWNPLLDRAPALAIGGLVVSGGWLSFASIVLRFCLTLGAALVLVAVTGFDATCAALGRLGAPRILVEQLLLLHRYLFVLVDEAARLLRAHALRAPEARRPGLRVAGSMLGQLLLRTLARAQRIHRAMLCRGFDGVLRRRGALRLRAVDLAFTGGWCAFFALARAVDLPRLLGGLALGAGR